MGFTIQSFIGFIECFSLMIIVLSALNFLLGPCWLFCSFAEDLTTDLNVLSIESSLMKGKEQICEIFKALADIHELSIDILMHRNIINQISHQSNANYFN